MEYTNKYDMTEEQNIFLAKRNIVDSIWKSKRFYKRNRRNDKKRNNSYNTRSRTNWT